LAVGCDAFDGIAEEGGEFDDYYTADDIGRPLCDIGFFSNQGGTDPNADVTANEACIVCGACQTCTGMCISTSFPFRNSL